MCFILYKEKGIYLAHVCFIIMQEESLAYHSAKQMLEELRWKMTFTEYGLGVLRMLLSLMLTIPQDLGLIV